MTSHGILDAMTYRTRGIPFFWPFDETRIVFPWRPIPPAPTGVEFFSKRGLEVVAVELVYFMPLVIAGIAPGLTRIGGWLRRLWGTVPAAAAVLPGAPGNSGSLVATQPQLTGGARAVFKLTGAVALVAVSLGIAQVYLSQSRVVAWIEQSTQENLAVSLMREPRFRHLR